MKIQKYWQRKKDKFKLIYPDLNWKDLDYRLGEEDKMIEMLSIKLGLPQQEILRIIITL